MDRRYFLRAVTALAAAGAAGACAQSGTTASAPSTAAGGTAPASQFDPIARVADGAAEQLSVISGSFEKLVGEARPYAFGVIDADNEPLEDVQLDVHVVPAEGQPTGPFRTTFQSVEGLPTGLYVAEVDIPPVAAQEGFAAFVAVTADGAQAGADTLRIATAETSALPAPGQEAPRAATPTQREPLGYERLCTDDPPCGMHQVGLAAALEAGRPIVLTFATPAYCQTAVCGPSVDVLDQVRRSQDWGDTAFVHCEVYSDAGQTLGQPVERWGLPSEPWLFAIDAGGMIVERADGPLLTLPDQVAAITEAAQRS